MVRYKNSYLLLLSVLSSTASVHAQEPTAQAAAAKELLRTHCLECHGGAVTRGRIKILDHDLLLKRKAIVPGKPEESPVYQLITSKDAEARMPPLGQPQLKPEEIDAIRLWIAAGAPAFPEDASKPAEDKKDPPFKHIAGVDHVLKHILTDVRRLSTEQRRFVRYFSLNHLLAAGATSEELERQRLALALAVNHLSWQPDLVKPRAVDTPWNTVYALDLRDLGWHVQPFDIRQGGRFIGKSPLNLFDLALLDYPYAIFYQASDTFELLVREYLTVAQPVRPIPYVRSDWFVSTVTQPPLYEDFLLLPFSLQELEDHLKVASADNVKNGIARRAGLTVSGVSRNNRVVERHPSPKAGYYWKSFDFRTSKGPENIFLDPVNLHPAGGEMIFGLPNGLQGYYVANGLGTRVDAAPTEIVTDKFASDQVVRNGLACMRCHDRGMKEFADTVRPVVLRLANSPGLDKRAILSLYPEQKELDRLLKQDRVRFENALKLLLGKLPASGEQPLAKVSKRYLDDPIHLATVAGELGLVDPKNLENVLRLPLFVGLGLLPLVDQGVVRRDAWEDYFDQVVQALGLGEPVVPLDGVLRRDFPALASPFDVQLKTTRKNNVVEPGEDIAILVVNRSPKSLYIELIGTAARGEKVILTPATLEVPPQTTYRFPQSGGIKVRGGIGKEQITLLASDTPFPAGVHLRGHGVTDRVLHTFFALELRDGRFALKYEPRRVIKRTLEIETR